MPHSGLEDVGVAEGAVELQLVLVNAGRGQGLPIIIILIIMIIIIIMPALAPPCRTVCT